jgi:hypothetical protein
MAQGEFLLFQSFSEAVSGLIDLKNNTFNIALISDTKVAVVGDATPQLADYTQVAGGNGYTTGGEALAGKTWVETAGTAKFDDSGTPSVTWTKNASGPTNIFQGLLYDITSAGDECVGFIDMTADAGTTPISLQSGDITITPHASGLFTLAQA